MYTNRALDVSDDPLGHGAAAPYGSRSMVHPTPSPHGPQRMQRLPPPPHQLQQHPPTRQQHHNPPQQGHPYLSGPLNYDIYSKHIYQGFRSKKVFGCAVCMLLFGGIHVLSGSIMAFLIGISAENFGGYGIWGGIIFILTGLFALYTSWWSSTCTVTFTFVLGVTSSLVAIVQFVLAILMCMKFFMAILDVLTLFSTLVTAIVLSIKCANCRSE